MPRMPRKLKSGPTSMILWMRLQPNARLAGGKEWLRSLVPTAGVRATARTVSAKMAERRSLGLVDVNRRGNVRFAAEPGNVISVRELVISRPLAASVEVRKRLRTRNRHWQRAKKF